MTQVTDHNFLRRVQVLIRSGFFCLLPKRLLAPSEPEPDLSSKVLSGLRDPVRYLRSQILKQSYRRFWGTAGDQNQNLTGHTEQQSSTGALLGEFNKRSTKGPVLSHLDLPQQIYTFTDRTRTRTNPEAAGSDPVLNMFRTNRISFFHQSPILQHPDGSDPFGPKRSLRLFLMFNLETEPGSEP